MCRWRACARDARLSAEWCTGFSWLLAALRDLPQGLKLAGKVIYSFAEQVQVDPSNSTLHVAVCNGSDALAVSDGAAEVLASGIDLLGSQVDDLFSSMELIGSEGPRNPTSTPKQIAQVGCCSQQLLCVILCLSAGSLMLGFVSALPCVLTANILRSFSAGGGCCSEGCHTPLGRPEGWDSQCAGSCSTHARSQWLHVGCQDQELQHSPCVAPGASLRESRLPSWTPTWHLQTGRC